ncbi:MAG TPA: hypothetical protein DCY72_04990 [Ruminococcaceae bacterium]|nr:hypothetical protein [Oscillospiraceae bacterium]
MKKLLTIITSMLLCMTMLVLSPAQVAASAADSVKKYISEVKVGMGETSEEASKELLEEGYTILADDKGNYADLNEGAGAKSPLKEGPNQKIVYLGYKTTDDASDAITDLAVMNMQGGYSYEDYEKLMQKQMDTQIKPFVNRFISTLSEYRENLKKSQDSANYKRAEYYRNMLNKLTDDDTGGKPLGDLLVNETKYEMGDEAYNALSEEEKKEHCDILTLLMQGNGQSVQLMETQLAKASDSSDDTWLDRFLKTDLDALTKSVKEENPGFTPSEIDQELDKRYYDSAKKIRDKWSAFNEILLNYDNAIEQVDEVAESEVKDVKLSDNPSQKEVEEVVVNAYESQANLVQLSTAAEDVTAHDYLEATKYGNGTLLEFFQKDVTEFNSEKKIRELYPIVDALSGGQLAGLDFLSIKDMIMMALTDENGYKTTDLSNVEPVSIFQDVNRELYEKGGVALTNKALREKASAQRASSTFELSKTGIVLWSCTAATAIAAVASVGAMKGLRSSVDMRQMNIDAKNLAVHRENIVKVNAQLEKPQGDWIEAMLNDSKLNSESRIKSIEPRYNAAKSALFKSNICKYLSVGFTVAAAILAGISIYTTVEEMKAFYKVDFVPIPKYIVEEADITATNEKGEKVMIKNQTAYYSAVTCNRKDGDSDVEKTNHKILLDRADLNGDVGQQWLALYSVKYVNGLPILADSLKLKLGKGGAPEGYSTGIHMFGDEAVQNLTDEKSGYSYNDPNEGTYVFFKRDTAKTAAGSLFSGGSLILGGLIGLAAGGLLTFAVIQLTNKKKKKKAEQAQSN